MSSSSMFRTKQDPMQKKRSVADNFNFGVGATDIKSLLNRSTMLLHRLCSFARRLFQAFAPSIRMWATLRRYRHRPREGGLVLCSNPTCTTSGREEAE